MHLITSRAKLGTCGSCGSMVIVGITEGLTVRVDPWSLDQLAEVVAIMLGRTTYTLDSSRRLVARCGGTLTGPALTDHVCGARLSETPLIGAKPSSDNELDTPQF